jgi:membrane protein required for colicin V production
MIASWNAFDWLNVTVIVISMALAARRGLVRAIFSLLGYVGGFELASNTYTDLADRIHFGHGIHSQTTARIVAFLLIAIGVALALEVIGRRVQRSLRAVGLSTFDRLLGSIFGFGRGCLICIALLMVVCNVAPQSEFLLKSTLSPYLFAVAHDVSFLVPQYLQQEMIDGAFDLNRDTPHWINRH